ncbi:GAF and ANTAR domain-containing protein [Nakamurella deserti]|uniref:GAF and ANTAR domain-containing protein n=1 Tax=Nakamurella deserti TaxID=2164074 RepID=UPI0013003DFB|nr:GAF and ANTAR domain-containing protein [Nakamurella deserti]
MVASPAEDDGDMTVSALTVVSTFVPGARWVTLTERRPGHSRIRTLASSDASGALGDELQLRLSQGPTVQAIRERTPVLVHDLTADTRWPDFSRAAVGQTPIRSVLSFPLHGTHDATCALTLYGAETHAFTGDAVYIASVAAGSVETALAGLAQRLRARNLHQALMSNRRIGVAVGILMAAHRWTEERAFQEMATLSQANNRKVIDLADEVILTGALPDSPPKV